MPKNKCAVCGVKENYEEPMADCKKCEKKICFVHTTSKLGREDVEDFCDECLKK